MTIYLDMDGVIADFFTEFCKVGGGVGHWKEVKDIESTLDSMKNTDFFYRLKPYPNTYEFVDAIKQVSGGDWGICSSPLRGDRDNSCYWKRLWLEKYGLMPDHISKVIFTANKHRYAVHKWGGKNILLDDKQSNVDKWNAAGGIGIRFQANEHTINYAIHQIRSVI